MLSKALRAASCKLPSIAARRSLHISAVRADLIQDLYSQEIKSFKPRQLSDKDAEGSVLKWSAPAAPKVPGEEVSVNEVDSYAKTAVEVDESAAPSESDELDTATSGDWFPIERFDAGETHH